MIKTIIDYNNAKLSLMGYFSKMYGLTTRVFRQLEDAEQRFPAESCGNGEFNNVSDFDFKYGLSYWKMNGKISMNESTTASLIGGKQIVIITYPLRLIVSIPKQKLSLDDAYSSERIANTLSKNLNDNNGALKTSLLARRVNVKMTGWEDIVDEIFTQEFTGVDVNYDYKYVLMSIDFDIEVEINKTCLEDECSAYAQTTCDILVAMVNPQNRRECILPEFDFSTDADFDALTPQQITDLTNRLCN